MAHPAGLLASIQVGRPQLRGDEDAVDPWDSAWFSGFCKNAVAGPVALRWTNLDGDEQADLDNHGGVDKAVCCYPAVHYDGWRCALNLPDLAFGGFGENFTIDGLAEPDVCIGDVWKIGTAVVQVSQPRQPCWKLARRWKIKTLTLQVQQTGRTGWYFRVLTEGVVAPGAPSPSTTAPPRLDRRPRQPAYAHRQIRPRLGGRPRRTPAPFGELESHTDQPNPERRRARSQPTAGGPGLILVRTCRQEASHSGASSTSTSREDHAKTRPIQVGNLQRPVVLNPSEAAMRIRHVGFAAAAWTAVAAAAFGGDAKSDAKSADRPITIIAVASPATLKVGARCQIELNPVTTGRTESVTVYDGVIARANDQGVGLTVTEERKTIAHTPFLGRFFRNVGIGRPAPGQKKEVWLPSATIHAVKLTSKDADGA